MGKFNTRACLVTRKEVELPSFTFCIGAAVGVNFLARGVYLKLGTWLELGAVRLQRNSSSRSSCTGGCTIVLGDGKRAPGAGITGIAL